MSRLLVLLTNPQPGPVTAAAAAALSSYTHQPAASATARSQQRAASSQMPAATERQQREGAYYLRLVVTGQPRGAGAGQPASGSGRWREPAGVGGARGSTLEEATGARERGVREGGDPGWGFQL